MNIHKLMFLPTCPLIYCIPIISTLMWWTIHSLDGSPLTLHLSYLDFPLCRAYAHITLSTSSSSSLAIDITLSLTLLDSTNLWRSSFTSTPMPSYPSWFPDHINYVFLSCKHIDLAPNARHLISCKKHKSSFLFHSSSHIYNPIPFDVPIFLFPSLISAQFLYYMLPAVRWWVFCWITTKLWNFTSFQIWPDAPTHTNVYE